MWPTARARPFAPRGAHASALRRPSSRAISFRTATCRCSASTPTRRGRGRARSVLRGPLLSRNGRRRVAMGGRGRLFAVLCCHGVEGDVSIEWATATRGLRAARRRSLARRVRLLVGGRACGLVVRFVAPRRRSSLGRVMHHRSSQQKQTHNQKRRHAVAVRSWRVPRRRLGSPCATRRREAGEN